MIKDFHKAIVLYEKEADFSTAQKLKELLKI